jgi:hypothetical protein
MQFSPWKGLIESPGWYQCDREVTTGLAEGCRSTIILHDSISQKTTLNSKDHIMLFKISMRTRKSFNENYQQFGSTLSKTLANSGLDEDESVLLNVILHKKSLDSIHVDWADPANMMSLLMVFLTLVMSCYCCNVDGVRRSHLRPPEGLFFVPQKTGHHKYGEPRRNTEELL